MLRKLLLPALAAAVLAGCASGYNYRGGNGDYYYGQPQVQYRSLDGYYSGFGLGYGYGGFGYDQNYYYDRYGRLVYGYSGGYYAPYYVGNGWYRPRPRSGHGDRDDHHGQNDHDRDDTNHDRDNHDRPPPWRDLGGLQQREQRDQAGGGYRTREQDQRPAWRAQSQSSAPMPMREQQRPEATIPSMQGRSSSSSRMGGFIGGAARSHAKRSAQPQP